MKPTPYREGYEAVLDGKDDSGFANPYPESTPEHIEWELGWRAAWEDILKNCAEP
jgi:ribosome modulation factor